MKKSITYLLLCFCLFCVQTAHAQIKIGYINTEELLAIMPETDKVGKDLTVYQAQLEQQNNTMILDLNKKDSLFIIDSLTLTKEQKNERRKELFGLYKEVQGFSQTAETALQKKQEELMQPVRKKAYDAISAVSKENKITYVLDVNSIIIAPPGDNILSLVKKKLGIVSAPPKTAVKPK